MDAPGARGRRRAARRAAEGAALACARSSPATPCSASTRATPTRRASRTARRTDTYAALRVEVGCVALGRRALLPADRQAAGRQAAEIAVAFRPSPHMPFEGADGWAGANRLIIGIQPGEKVLAARHGQAARRRARARQGRARLRRGRGRPARRAGGLRAPARGRDRRRHEVVHLQRRGRGPVGRDRPAAARAPRARPLRAGLGRPRAGARHPGPRRPTVAPARVRVGTRP